MNNGRRCIWLLAQNAYKSQIRARSSGALGFSRNPDGKGATKTSALESSASRNKENSKLKSMERYGNISTGTTSGLNTNQLPQKNNRNDASYNRIRDNEQKKIGIRDGKMKKDKSVKKIEKNKKIKFEPLTNDAINFDKINYIDLEGNHHANVDKASVLQSFANKKKMYTLALIQPRTATCRLFLTSDYREHARKVQHANQPKSSKQLQLTWNIGDNDLLYRLKRAAKYLEQEGRLDIILGAKNPKLVRDRSQREAMLATIRSTLGEYGYEWRKMTGGFPMAELWFVGYPAKAKKIGTQQDAVTDPEVSVVDRDPPENISADAFESSSYKVRDRAGVLNEADKEYKRLFALKSHDTTSEDYWAKLAVHSSQAMSTIPDYSAQSASSKQTANMETDEVIEAEVAEPSDGQDRLKSIAVQFSKLGSKSIFGSKLSSR